MRGFDLTALADEDLVGIWLYTYETWGPDQADKYYDQIIACCEAIADESARSKTFEGLPLGVSVLRCQQHYIFFMPDNRPIIFAILHERMNFLERLKSRL